MLEQQYLLNYNLEFTAANGGKGNATDPFRSRERVRQHGMRGTIPLLLTISVILSQVDYGEY